MLGEIVGNYRITGVLSRGGMGAVYTAEHTLIGRKAAVKVLLPELSVNESIVNRFFNEARATAAIGHPGIVEVFDFGHKDGRAYLIMELLAGMPLNKRLTEPMPLERAIALMEHVLSALSAAHAKGIVHRDLKPANIMLVPDPGVRFGERAKLLDFGIAKLADDTSSGDFKTRTGLVMGTPAYMAPEQCRGAGTVDQRADLYALGCILFHMLCGRPPFVGEGGGEIIGMQQFMPPPSPRSINPGLDPGVEDLILRLLAKDPAARPQSANALLEELTMLSPSGGMSGWSPQARQSSSSGIGPRPGTADEITREPSTGGAATGGVRTPMSAPGSGRVMAPQLQVTTPARPQPRPMALAPPMPTPAPGDLPFMGAWPTPAPQASDPPSTIGAAVTAGNMPVRMESVPSPQRWGLRALVAVLVTASAAGGLWLGMGSEPAGTRAAAVPPPVPDAAPVQTRVPETSGTEADAQVRAAADTPATEPVILTFESEPPGAEVYLDGQRIGITPMEHQLAPGTSALALKLEKDGYVSKELEVEADQSRKVTVVLDKASRKSRQDENTRRGESGAGKSRPPRGDTDRSDETKPRDRDSTINPFE